MSKENGKEEELVFNIGDVINGYKLVEKIDEGGFGQVFKCTKDNAVFAMKLESNSQDGGSAIKLEMSVLTRLNHIPVFPTFYNGGRRRRYHYLVLELLGDNLKMLKSKSPNPEALSDGTWSRVGIQCLYALKKMHDNGFVHRDIKPSNFAVGFNTSNEVRSRRILLFDFGLARRFVRSEMIRVQDSPKVSVRNIKSKTKTAVPAPKASRKNKNQPGSQNNFKTKLALKPPKEGDNPNVKKEKKFTYRVARPHTDFRGTHQYASPNAHTQIELGRHDDIWSLMYMVAEMFLELPWTSNDTIPIEDVKSQACIRRIFTDDKNPARLTPEMASKLDLIDQMLKECNYYSHPAYDLVHDFFQLVMQKSEATWMMPYDWEVGMKPEELSKLIEKANKSERQWEKPEQFFKKKEWEELKVPSKNMSNEKQMPSNPMPSHPTPTKLKRSERKGKKIKKESREEVSDGPEAQASSNNPSNDSKRIRSS